MVIPSRPRLFQLAQFTLFVFVLTNLDLGCSLPRHDLEIHERVAPASNRDIVLFLLMVTGKFMSYSYCLMGP